MAKAEVLARKASRRPDHLTLVPFVGEFREFNARVGRARRVFTTVDSRNARRTIRNELPLAVLDASTTDLSEVVVFSERQPTDRACLSCIYRHVPEELQRERHVAEGLLISVEQARQPYISQELARELAAKHPSLEADEIVGLVLSSVYREVCGAGQLMTALGQQALAPLGFISNLAGAMLALELVRIHAALPDLPRTNYLALDPWRPPYEQARRLRARHLQCEFCGDDGARIAMQSVWPEVDFSAA